MAQTVVTIFEGWPASQPVLLRWGICSVSSFPGNRRRYTAGMNRDLLAEALKLSPSDRLQLIEALWDTLSEEDIPVTPEERALLDARLADLEANPGDQSPWSEVRARLE
jgi:putative addiction module component (TIGR02574 family)